MLKKVNDGIVAFAADRPKPWGKETLLALGMDDRYAMKILHLEQKTSLQLHTHKRETIVLISGEAFLLHYESGTGQKVQLPMEPFVGYNIEEMTGHQLIAGASGAVLVEASTPEVGATWRISDPWGRGDEILGPPDEVQPMAQ